MIFSALILVVLGLGTASAGPQDAHDHLADTEFSANVVVHEATSSRSGTVTHDPITDTYYSMYKISHDDPAFYAEADVADGRDVDHDDDGNLIVWQKKETYRAGDIEMRTDELLLVSPDGRVANKGYLDSLHKDEAGELGDNTMFLLAAGHGYSSMLSGCARRPRRLGIFGASDMDYAKRPSYSRTDWKTSSPDEMLTCDGTLAGGIEGTWNLVVSGDGLVRSSEFSTLSGTTIAQVSSEGSMIVGDTTMAERGTITLGRGEDSKTVTFEIGNVSEGFDTEVKEEVERKIDHYVDPYEYEPPTKTDATAIRTESTEKTTTTPPKSDVSTIRTETTETTTTTPTTTDTTSTTRTETTTTTTLTTTDTTSTTQTETTTTTPTTTDTTSTTRTETKTTTTRATATPVKCCTCDRFKKTVGECGHLEKSKKCSKGWCIENIIDTATCKQIAKKGKDACKMKVSSLKLPGGLVRYFPDTVQVPKLLESDNCGTGGQAVKYTGIVHKKCVKCTPQDPYINVACVVNACPKGVSLKGSASRRGLKRECV